MKLERYLRAATLAVIFSVGNAQAGGEGWISDFEAAKKQAVDGKKSLLIDFTGSDWCGWCIKLNKEVFVHDAFKNGVKDKFVLVELDFPKDKSKITEAVSAQNETLKTKYGVEGFPTILLTDEQGKPFAKTGYQPGGPEAYVKHLDELLALREKRDAAFAEADKAEGVAKAKSLIAAIQSMDLSDEIVSSFYADKVAAIKAADPKDESGYLKGLETKVKFTEFQNKLNELGGKQDFEGVVKHIDETLATNTFEGELKQQSLIFKSMAYMQLKKPEDALKTLDEAKTVSPESPISGYIDKLKTRIEASVPK
ncbi:MAG: thioredoxin family protein [Verrucomicrobiota bacterium]